MKLPYLLISIFLCVSNTSAEEIKRKDAVTFILNGGRLGDNLLNLWRAAHFSHCYNIPFYYPPFAYSDRLMLSSIEKKYSPHMDKQFQRIVNLKQNSSRVTPNNRGILYKINFYFRSSCGNGYNNTSFKNYMQQILKPKFPLALIEKIPGHINIAMHVRRGSGADFPFSKSQRIWPTKFPPISYYIDALKKICELQSNQPVHAHIFTDANNPHEIVRTFKRAFLGKNISFSFRENNKDAHKRHVLKDLFSMARFDCLIRSSSGISRIAELIGNHEIVIAPSTPVWKNNMLHISKLNVIDKRKL